VKLATRVLIVDDEARLVEALAKAAQAFGYEPLRAEGVPQALEVLGALSVDIILLDLSLKGHSGLTLLAGLDKAGLEVPTIMLSGTGAKKDVVAALRLGAVDWLDKPVSRPELKDAIERALARVSRRRKRRRRSQVGETAEHTQPQTAEEQAEEERKVAVRAAIAALVTQVEEGTLSLPSLDPVAQELRELFHSPDPGVAAVLELVERDPATSASILKVANSSRYQGGQTITTLRSACVRLGNRRVLTIAQEVMARDLFMAGSGTFGEIADAMWANTRVSSEGARRLAEIQGVVDPDEAHLSALFHNLGELVLLRAFRELVGLKKPTVSELRMFREEVDEHHEEVGGRLLGEWGFAADFAKVASAHHVPAGKDESEKVRELRLLALAAWKLALTVGFTYLPKQEKLKPWAEVAELGLDRPEVERIFRNARSWID
jgi:HD-like signal output (HDOD) protein/CheY-like chemotaxis protein